MSLAREERAGGRAWVDRETDSLRLDGRSLCSGCLHARTGPSRCAILGELEEVEMAGASVLVTACTRYLGRAR